MPFGGEVVQLTSALMDDMQTLETRRKGARLRTFCRLQTGPAVRLMDLPELTLQGFLTASSSQRATLLQKKRYRYTNPHGEQDLIELACAGGLLRAGSRHVEPTAPR